MSTPPFSDDTLLARWLAGGLSEEELRLLEGTSEFPQYKRLIDHLSRMQAPEFDAEAGFDGLMAGLAARTSPPHLNRTPKAVRGGRLWLRPLFAAAATVALLIAAWLLWPAGAPEFLAPAGSPGQRISLKDGSSVRLNAQSSLDFAMEDGQRAAQLAGEAYFEVAKSTLPFVVMTDNGKVIVMGTAFNVYSRGDSMRVSVSSGSVRVTFTNGEGPFLLSPSQSVTHWKDGTTVAGALQTEKDLDWLEGRSVFIDRPLREVLDELERQYDLEIIRPASLREDARYNVTFPNNRIDLALRSALDPIREFRYEQNGRVITLVPTD